MKKSSKLGDGFEKLTEQVLNLFKSYPRDIGAAIKMDHDSLRNYLGVLKDTDEKMSVRRRAYDAFSELLKSHSLVEETVVYGATLKMPGRELRIKVAEGFVEHQLATDIMRRMAKTSDSLEWSAHANVLSEIIEHHLKEEERDLIPLLRKAETASLDKKLLEAYLQKRLRTQKKVTKKNAGVLKKVRGSR